MPALLKSRSTRPKAFTVASNSASTSSGLAILQDTASAPASVLPASAMAASRTCLRRPQNTVFQPALRRAVATALPIPVPAPVTMAVLLSATNASRIEHARHRKWPDAWQVPDKKGGHWRPPRSGPAWEEESRSDYQESCAFWVNETLTRKAA